MIKYCEYCNKEFEIKRGHNNQRFCCKSCSVKARNPEDIGLFGNNYNNKIVSYILGIILTDGCITRRGNRDTIVIGLNDKYMVEMIRDYVCPQKKIYKCGNGWQVIWRNEKDVEILRSMSITNRKTFTTKFIMLEYDIWHFIRGIFDGDGCVYYSRMHDKKYNRDYTYTCVTISTASITFAEGINKFLNDNNIKSRIIRDSRDREMYYVKIMKQFSVELFAKYIYKDSGLWRLERKYNKFYHLQ